MSNIKYTVKRELKGVIFPNLCVLHWKIPELPVPTFGLGINMAAKKNKVNCK